MAKSKSTRAKARNPIAMKSTAAQRRKSLDSAIGDIAHRAFRSAFNEAVEAAAKIHPTGGMKRTLEVYYRALAETVRDHAARDPWRTEVQL